MYILGIDTGKYGAFSMLKADKFQILYMSQFELIGKEVDFTSIKNQLFKFKNGDHIVPKNKPMKVFIEDLSINALFGKAQIASQAKTFARIQGMLDAFNISYELVMPQKWQKAVHGTGKGLKAKEKSFEAIQRLFPNGCWDAKKDGIIDATLIAYYGAMKMGGNHE